MAKTVLSIELNDDVAEKLEQVDLGDNVNKKIKAYLLRKLKANLQTELDQVDNEIKELEK